MLTRRQGSLAPTGLRRLHNHIIHRLGARLEAVKPQVPAQSACGAHAASTVRLGSRGEARKAAYKEMRCC